MATTTFYRTLANVVSILSSDVANRATTFIFFALVARYLGTHQFGQMSLALSLFYTFQVLAAAGLKTLITRQVAKDRGETARYLVNGSVLVIISSAFAITTLLFFVLMMGYPNETASIILLLSIGLLPYALSSVSEAIFQAWERMHYIAYANVSVSIARTALGFLILHQGYGIYHLIFLLMIFYVALVSIEWWLIFRFIMRPVLIFDLRFSLRLARSTSTFLGIDVLIAIVASMNIVLLSKLSSETEVGLYSAAVHLLTPVMLVLQSIVLSVFPTICKRLDSSFTILKPMLGLTLALLMALVLPVVTGLFFLANPVLLLLYGRKDFLQASGLLQITVWSLIPTALMSVLGYTLVAAHRERLTLGLVTVHAIGNLVLGLVLIEHFGAKGAVVVLLVDKVIGFCEHYVLVSRLLGSIGLARVVWRPVVASICMAAYLAFVGTKGVVLPAVTSGIIYAGMLLMLTIWSLDGPSQLRARYLYWWSESRW